MKMAEMSDEIKVKAAKATSDNEEYKRCMSIIKARLLTVNEIISDQIIIPYQMKKDGEEIVLLDGRRLMVNPGDRPKAVIRRNYAALAHGNTTQSSC